MNDGIIQLTINVCGKQRDVMTRFSEAEIFRVPDIRRVIQLEAGITSNPTAKHLFEA